MALNKRSVRLLRTEYVLCTSFVRSVRRQRVKYELLTSPLENFEHAQNFAGARDRSCSAPESVNPPLGGSIAISKEGGPPVLNVKGTNISNVKNKYS